MVPDRSAPALFGFGCAAGLVLGALACVQMPMLLPLWLSVPMAIAGVGGWLLPWRGRAWAAALLGLAWATVHGHWVLHGQLPPGAPPQDVQVRGRVADLPQQGPGYTRFVLHVEDAGALPSLRGKRLQVTWNDPRRGSPAHEAEGGRHAVRAGSHWQLSLRVRAPRSRINPGGFDGERHAVLRGISGNASVRDPARAREWLPAQGLQAWRERSSAAIAVQVAHPAARFVQALALGDTRGLSDADWEHLRALGLTHLVAISGFHVGVVAGFGVLLCRLWWWLCPLLGRYWPRPQAAAWGAALAAATYAMAAGGALPTVRAALMIGLVALARAGRRPVGAGQGLALAAMVMLLPAPLSVLSAGFWLSFGGVLWLLWCLPRTGPEGIGGGLRGFLAAQGVASLGLLPLCIALFGGTARLGPLVNLPVIPWWTMLVVPLSLLGTGLHVLHDGAGRWAWRAAAWLFELSWGPCSRWRCIRRRCGGWPRRRAGRYPWPCWACSGGCCRAAPAVAWRACCCACRCCGRPGMHRLRGTGAAGARCRPGHGGAGAHGAARALVRRGAADWRRGQRTHPGPGPARARPGPPRQVMLSHDPGSHRQPAQPATAVARAAAAGATGQHHRRRHALPAGDALGVGRG